MSPVNARKGQEHLAARHAVLEKAAEEMIALIRLHVAGCEPCASPECRDAMRDLVRRIDLALAAARLAVENAGHEP